MCCKKVFYTTLGSEAVKHVPLTVQTQKGWTVHKKRIPLSWLCIPFLNKKLIFHIPIIPRFPLHPSTIVCPRYCKKKAVWFIWAALLSL